MRLKYLIWGWKWGKMGYSCRFWGNSSYSLAIQYTDLVNPNPAYSIQSFFVIDTMYCKCLATNLKMKITFILWVDVIIIYVWFWYDLDHPQSTSEIQRKFLKIQRKEYNFHFKDFRYQTKGLTISELQVGL